MKYNQLGSSGLQISRLSYGAWVTFGDQIGLADAVKLMNVAREAGVNFFDNAETYADGQAELLMGRVFKKVKWSRDSFIVSSKAFFGVDEKTPWPTTIGLSRKHLVEACHQALGRLQLEYLDLYFCHRPDPKVPVSEIVETMTNLVRQGKVLYWGTSMWPADKITEAYEFAKANHLVAPTMEQPQYNMFEREKVEKEFAPLYKKYGLGMTIWSPLAWGLLTGKYSKGIPAGSRLSLKNYAWLKERAMDAAGQKKLQLVGQIKTFADDVGLSLPRFALAWCLKNPNVSTVILGASKVSQLKENLLAIGDVEKMTNGVMSRVDRVLSGVQPFAPVE
jgi:voltage-dependent potassium channel beta subunit